MLSDMAGNIVAAWTAFCGATNRMAENETRHLAGQTRPFKA
jgi:hypothetical protein